MARVQMLISITGGRGDGTEWPSAGQVLACGGEEAQALVRGGMAKWLPEAAESAADGPESAPAGDEADDGENGSQPRVRDPKENWEMHAVTVHGVTPELAASMTKADLIQQYGTTPA